MNNQNDAGVKSDAPLDPPKTVTFSRCEYCSGFEQKIDSAQEDAVAQQIALGEKEKILRELHGLLQDSELTAEDIFEQMKYRVATYVIKHEFNARHNLSVNLTLWLETCQDPKSYETLRQVMKTYLKRI